MLYSPPPKLEITGLPRRWVTLLIRDINNCNIYINGFHRIARIWLDPGDKAVCSNRWIPHIKKHTNKLKNPALVKMDMVKCLQCDGFIISLRLIWRVMPTIPGRLKSMWTVKPIKRRPLHRAPVSPMPRLKSLCCSLRLFPLLFSAEMDISWSLSL